MGDKRIARLHSFSILFIAAHCHKWNQNMLLKDQIRDHFDLLSPYYHQLWGVHVHHGYWRNGQENKEQAQAQLIETLIEHVRFERGASVLDVGCGIGGTAIYLAKNYAAKVTGITLSAVQVQMATALAEQAEVAAQFLQMDGEAITLDDNFDVIWSVEVISHYLDKENFFRHAARLCRPGGKVALGVWLRAEHLTAQQRQQYIEPIEQGMLLPGLSTLHDYLGYFHDYGFRLLYAEDVTAYVSKTWDLCLNIIANKSLWQLARQHGPEVVRFLKAFRAMRAGCASRSFVYAMITAEKIG